jgi:hypothetical protein
MYCGLITKKHRGFFAKFLEILIQRINFVKEIPVDSVHGAVDHRNPGPRWAGHGWMAPSSPELSLRSLRCSRAPPKGKTGSGKPFWASPEGERR